MPTDLPPDRNEFMFGILPTEAADLGKLACLLPDGMLPLLVQYLEMGLAQGIANVRVQINESQVQAVWFEVGRRFRKGR